MEQGMQRRTELLLGKDNLEKLQAARVLIFGIGGVGSWCAEGLVRSGVRHITIVDSSSYRYKSHGLPAHWHYCLSGHLHLPEKLSDNVPDLKRR